jgi:hypothetical protein
MLRFSLVAFVVLAQTSAGAEPPQEDDAFGAALTLEVATPLPQVIAQAERYAKQPVLVRGTLTDVCQRKGCWTVIRDQGAHVRVRFKDYGFFLPKDSMGRGALVEGVVTIETLSEKEARHYEEESRQGDPDSVKGPRREVGFLASGVRLLPR